MSRMFYELEPAAPIRGVWFTQCDVCRKAYHGPERKERDLPDLPNLTSMGWRALSYTERGRILRETGRRLPWDTCPDCLARETGGA